MNKQQWSGAMPGKKLEGYVNGCPVYSIQQGEMDDEEYKRLLEMVGDNIYAIDEDKFVLPHQQVEGEK